jgi:hypothetical protein
MFKLLIFALSICRISGATFVGSRRPKVEIAPRCREHCRTIVAPQRFPNSSICCRENLTSLYTSNFDFPIETDIASILFIAAFVVALQRLSTIEDFELNRFSWPDFIRNSPFSTAAAVDTRTVSDSVTDLDLQTSTGTMESKTSLEQVPIEDEAIRSAATTPTSPVDISNFRGTVLTTPPPKTDSRKSPPPPLGSAKREDFSTVKKTIANTFSGQKVKMERLKATEPINVTDIPSQEVIDQVETRESLQTNTVVVQSFPRKVRGRKRKFILKLLKKIIMPWRKWSSL